MKIKLTKNLPVTPEHNCFAGKVFDVVRTKPVNRPHGLSRVLYIIKPTAGRMLIGVYQNECEVVEE